jgi:hypothetical protein
LDVVRRLFLAYLAVIVAPLVVASAVFAVRDRLARRSPSASAGNGHAEAEALEYTVEEVQAI